LQIPSPLEEIHLPVFIEKGLKVFVKRDDLIHPIISGNKWRKLILTLQYCLETNKVGIITVGGAHSNHIVSTAFLGKKNGLSTVGIIRGERPRELSSTLKQCEEMDMKLLFISREEYKQVDELKTQLLHGYSNYYWVPEGGADELGVEGCQDIVKEISVDFDFISVDCGTAATLAGITRAILPHQKAIGISVLKGEDTLSQSVINFNKKEKNKGNFELITDYHFGGYAHFSEKLVDFMQWFYAQTGIQTDPIYTAKQFYGVMDLIKKDYFPKGSTIVMVHTGGFQGIEGYEKRYGIKIF